MVWKKDKIGKGCYSRENGEILVIGTKGAFPRPLPQNLVPMVREAPRRRHAEKPEMYYEMLEKYYPGYAKVELFCRSVREGWAAWGNEIIPVGLGTSQAQAQDTQQQQEAA
jgi:N6-adenosine-specific RNA methylase IME4